MFHTLKLSNFRQFKEIDVAFDRHVTILTGANGAGKTTLLNVLNRHFGWNINLNSSYLEIGEKRKNKYISDLSYYYETLIENPQNEFVIGNLKYWDGSNTHLLVPKEPGTSYAITYRSQKDVMGMHIPSHRPINSYFPIKEIPTDPKTSAQQYQEFQQFLQQVYNSQNARNPGHVIKSSLIGLGVFGYNNEAIIGREDYRNLFEKFQAILKILMPKEIGFEKLKIQAPEIILITKSGPFTFDSVSGGISSIIGIAWQIFMFGHDKSEYVITFDEPENHLHPSMQREILPNLVEAFPNCQFIVTTHSPFIVSSSEKSRVYSLRHDENGKVSSTYLDLLDKSGTASEILREVLGVPVTLPKWVEEKIKEVTQKYQGVAIDETTFNNLKNDLKAVNMDRYLPDALSGVNWT